MNLLVLSAMFAVLFVPSLVGVIVGVVFEDRLSESANQILVLLLPLEICIICFGVPFLLCLCFFLVGAAL